jgi:Domain of unknown function (DUF1906)
VTAEDIPTDPATPQALAETIRAAPAPVGQAFDCSSKLTSRLTAQSLYAQGYRAVGRYVPLPANGATQDIDAAELDMLVEVGFAVWLVQHVRYAGWMPANANGAVDAIVACGAARNAGYPPGAHIFLDLEGISGTAEQTAYYAETWASNVVRMGWAAGVYCGYQNPLDAQALYLLHGVSSYWSDAGHRAVMTRGCAIHQGPTRTVAGVEVDLDTIGPDLLGDLPMMATV